MKHLKKFSEISEGFFDFNFGRPTAKKAAEDSMRGTGSSGYTRGDQEYGKDPDPSKEAVIFQGRQFTQDQIEYADYNDMGEIPRIEGDKLIIANPVWEM